MAPTRTLIPRIGGAIVAAILTVFVVAFICIFLYEYQKGSRFTRQSGTPIHIGEVAKNVFVTTLTLGLAGICYPKRFTERTIPDTSIRRETMETPTHIGDGS